MASSSIELGWRKFNFFEKQPVLDPTDKTQKFNAFKDLKISCWTALNDGVLLGEKQGIVLRVGRDLQIQAWKAHVNKLTAMCLVQSRFLFTVGEDEENAGASIKLWDLGQWANKDEPSCKVLSKLAFGRSKTTPSPAVSIAAAETMDLVCIGLEDTTVIYYYGDLRSDRTYKWKMLREGQSALNDGQMLGVAVAALPTCSVVFTITENCLQSFQIESGSVQKKVQHDAKSCQPNCWYFCSSTNTLALASREMIYFYDAHNCVDEGNEKGRCLGLERGVNKLQLLSHGSHVVLLTQKAALLQTTDSPTTSSLCMLNIYDVEFRYIAFQCPIPSACQMFLFDGEVCLIGTDGVLNKVAEMSLQKKLNGLIEKSLFDVAIGLAKRHSYPSLKDIYFKYASYLYEKGDYENSIQQYIETIGKVEPSYVIKKFLDGARISQLCQYLEFLHAKHLANGQHATLLLGAYVKQNAKEKINSFVEKISDISGFNIEQAIKVLRSTEYSKLAAKLTYRHKLYDLYLAILFEDLEDYGAAFKFISKQPIDQMCTYMEKYGPILIENNRSAVVEMLRKMIAEKPENSKELQRILLIKPDCLEDIFKQEDGAMIVPTDARVCLALLETKLATLKARKQTANAEQLEELYQLISYENAKEAAKLGRQFLIPPLVIYCYQKTKNSEDLMRYLLREGNVQQILEMCDEKDIGLNVCRLKDMWIELVTHVSQKEDLNTGDLMILLDKAKTSKYLHPLVVLEILARNEKLKVADIKDYIVNWLNEQNVFIKENEQKIAENNSEIERMEKRNEELETGVQIFQTNKCSICHSTLQVPAIHFLCNHSYHKHCFDSFSEGRDQCPTCASSKQSEPREQTPKHQGFSHDIPARTPKLNRCHWTYIKIY
ncbi:putative RING finger protein R06F6.2in [Aphelenchoides bicaudatus]|nr:putative RING finger protein R06F6.2in [Aphelenchoides bicaudatus]